MRVCGWWVKTTGLQPQSPIVSRMYEICHSGSEMYNYIVCSDRVQARVLWIEVWRELIYDTRNSALSSNSSESRGVGLSTRHIHTLQTFGIQRKAPIPDKGLGVVKCSTVSYQSRVVPAQLSLFAVN